MNTTGSVGGEFNTPYAFSKKDKDQEDTMEKVNSDIGFTTIKGLREASIEDMQDMSAFLSKVPVDVELRDDEGKTLNGMKRSTNEAFRSLGEALTEARSTYTEFNNDESKSPRHKIAVAIMDVKHALREVNRQMAILQKFKNESDLSPDNYWKRTHKNFSRIKEYVVGLVRDLQELERSGDI